jgi:hypothetical protein
LLTSKLFLNPWLKIGLDLFASFPDLLTHQKT